MLDFKIIQEFEPNEELIKTFKECKFKYRARKGTIKECLHTSLHFVVPTIYLIAYPIKCIIHEYLEWVKLMNNYKNMTEEIIFKELIYV